MTHGPADAEHADAVVAAVRRVRLSVVATLVRLTGDFDLAEDCLQDAVERALVRWQVTGVPDSPEAWLRVAARNRAFDVLRHRRTEHDKLPELHAVTCAGGQRSDGPGSAYDDDRLKLLFACCHPALPLAGRVALTLKTVTGLSTREVARAFLVSERAMSQRLLRTKTKIADAGIAMRVPPTERLADRLDAVLTVVYLLFNEGYSATEGQPLRNSLTREAIQLGTLLVDLLPERDEARALLALMLLQDSRRGARVNSAGEVVPIDEQDRACWDRDQISAGIRVLTGTLPASPPGPYMLQAAIAALHATAPAADQTDWTRIVQAYDALLSIRYDPVFALNRLVAVSFRDGPEEALVELAEVKPDLVGYSRLPAIRADMLRRAGRNAEAAAAYRDAVSQSRNGAERLFLERRLAEVNQGQ